MTDQTPAGSIKQTLTAWLQIGRLHTASAEIGAFAIAGYLAGIRGVNLIPIAAFAVLYHFVGFGENSLVDWLKGYDVDDPNKQHHPLNTSALKPDIVKHVIILTQLIGVLGFILLMYFYNHFSYLGVILFILAVILGNVYNFYAKSYKPAAPLEISFSYLFIVMSIFMVVGGINSVRSGLFFAFVFFYILSQIAFAGELKDISNLKEPNLLRMLNVEADGDRLDLGGKGLVFLFMLTIPKLVLIVLISIASYGISAIGVLTMVVAILMIAAYFNNSIRMGGNHDTALKVMGAGEALTYIALVLVVGLSPVYLVSLIAVPMAWFVVFNMIEWKTLIKPAV